MILLKERVRATTIVIAIIGRAITIAQRKQEKKQRTDTKSETKKIKKNNFPGAIDTDSGKMFLMTLLMEQL